ncbi:MAG: hypothetical protein AB1Z98_26600, partial [Nannocystaceae bacterium]
MTAGKRGFVGHADLVELLVAFGHERGDDRTAPGLTAAAEQIEYEVEVVEPEAQRLELPDLGDLELDLGLPRPREPESSSEVIEPAPFWRPVTCEWDDEPTRKRREQWVEDDDGDAAAEAAEREEMAAIPPPAIPPLSTSRRLLPLVRRALTAHLPGGEIDVDMLVEQLGRGEPLLELPHRPRHAWPSVLVLVDRDFGLVPLWHDQELVLERLQQTIGTAGVVIRFIDETGPERGVFDANGEPASLHDAALTHLPVLALTDLGWCRDASHRLAWLRTGRALRRAGQRLHALVPVPSSRWTVSLTRTWCPLAWERPAPTDGEELSTRASRLLDLAALTHRLEPGLLRVLRRLLPREEADMGTELDAWRHRDVASMFPLATVLRAECVAERRARLVRDRADLAAAAVEQLRNGHWHAELGPEVWHAEALALDRVSSLLVPQPQLERAEAFAERLGRRSRAQVRGGASADSLDGLRRWLDYVEERAPAQVWRSGTRVGRGLQLAWWATHGVERPPHDADPKLRALVEGDAEPVERQLTLRQWGAELVEDDGQAPQGSPVATIAAADPRVFV